MYWFYTGLLAGYLLLSTWSYVFSAAAIEGLRDLGFPDFFRWQLAILKVLAAGVLLLPGLPLARKEWAYAGVAFFIITAIVAHAAHRDGWIMTLINLLLLALVFLSRQALLDQQAAGF